ncbi:MAG: AraC family transcriptional regulator, partial [Pseudomonadota bacterium]
MARISFPEYAFPKLSRRPTERGKKRFVFLISPNPDPLEYIGPMNALRLANFVFENSDVYDCGYEPEIISSEPGVVFEQHGLKLQVDKAYSELEGDADTLVVSPMNWEDLFGRDDNLLPWLRKQQKVLRRIGSICSAAFVLAEAGILNGRRATTHWDLVPDLQARYPEVIVDGKPLYVRDDNVYTAAGMTAGVDITIAMIEEDYGREVALR